MKYDHMHSDLNDASASKLSSTLFEYECVRWENKANEFAVKKRDSR